MLKRLLAAPILVIGLAAMPAMAAEHTVTLKVDNMTCASCPLIVKKSLTKVNGVSAAQVSYEKETATVTFDDSKTTVAALVDATTKAGYPSKLAQ